MELLIMTTRRKTLAWCIVMALGLGSTTSPADAGSTAEPLAVVVGKDSSIDGLSMYELKRLYLGDDIRPGGKRALPLNRGAKTAEREGFDESVLGMTPEQSARYWIDRRIRGKSGAPKAVEPASVVQRVVSKLPGAISYVRLKDVDANSVKVIKINGKAPGDAGYPVVLDNASGSQASWSA
jgi:ABC-type phosphate transport system substrate-binding protein